MKQPSAYLKMRVLGAVAAVVVLGRYLTRPLFRYVAATRSQEAFTATTEKLWNEVKPLYQQLHCYTRKQLNAKYGDGVQAKTGPIRADLLGNMWAQEWGNIYDIVAPKGAGDVYDWIGWDPRGVGDSATAGQDRRERCGVAETEVDALACQRMDDMRCIASQCHTFLHVLPGRQAPQTVVPHA